MEFLKEIVSPLVPLIMKQMAYPFTTSSNIEALESATRELKALKDDVKAEITNATRKNGDPTKQAEDWLSQVDTIEKEAEENIEKYRQLCWCMWDISPNLWSSYKISRSAANNLVEVKSLCEKKKTIELVIYKPPPLAQEMPASSSKSLYLQQALKHIKDDEDNTIGIWGMGGVGKTHILKQINNELTRDGAFDMVVFLTCSKDCSEEKVQVKLIEKLGLNASNDVEQRQSTIFKFLQKKSFVLLLDDLWNRIDLEQIGISDLSGKRKVVLTTRSEEVCDRIEVRKRIKVDVLNRDDAWSLFEEKVTKETINSHPLIKEYATEVVKKLGGLPVALITIGRAMYDKRDLTRWELAVTRLKQACLDEDLEESVFRTLIFSYENLKNDSLKQCLLHCALFPEDYIIKRIELVELWMGLGLIDEPDIQTAYNVGYENIGKLQAACLLEEAEEDTLLETVVGIKMHDVIRDMALWIARDYGVEKYKWIVQTDTYKERQVIKVSHETEKMSLICSGAGFSICVSCPYTKLSTLLLYDNQLMMDAKSLRLESFCELTVLNLSWNCCGGYMPFPSIEICKLVKLQFLKLSREIIRWSLPKEFEALINLKYLLLREMGCTVPKGILSKLKALRVFNSAYILYGEGDNNSEISSSLELEEELKGLPELQALGISIRNKQKEECLSFTSFFIGNSHLQSKITDLKVGGEFELVKFERAIGDHRICCLGRLERLSFKNMWDMKEVVWKSLNPNDIFPILQVLIFHRCYDLKSISWVVCLPRIQELRVEFCYNMEQLVCISELNNDAIMTSQPSLASLKKMTLTCNDELESISDPMITFSALEYLRVNTCNKLKKLPFKSSNPPKKLELWGSEEWWKNIEMEDSTHRSLLQPFFREWEIGFRYG